MLSSKVRIYRHTSGSNVSNKGLFILTSHIALDHTGITPLIEAVKNNHVDIVKVLLDRGPFFSPHFQDIN